MRRLLAVFLALATPAAAQDPLSGAWTGSYTCGQGVTGLTLHLDRAGPELRGVFHFYPLPENPLAAEGCFEMTGGTDPADPAAVALRATRWLSRPWFYVTVDLDGEVTPEGAFTGDVAGPGCGTFTLRRASKAPPLPPACRPAAVSSR